MKLFIRHWTVVAVVAALSYGCFAVIQDQSRPFWHGLIAWLVFWFTLDIYPLRNPQPKKYSPFERNPFNPRNPFH